MEFSVPTSFPPRSRSRKAESGAILTISGVCRPLRFTQKEVIPMQTKLYVGNLSYSANESDLYTLFRKYGDVKTVNLITDKYSGQSKGFAFVEMSKPEEAEKALGENGSEFMGRALNVSEARPPKQYESGGRGRGGGGFGGNRRS